VRRRPLPSPSGAPTPSPAPEGGEVLSAGRARGLAARGRNQPQALERISVSDAVKGSLRRATPALDSALIAHDATSLDCRVRRAPQGCRRPFHTKRHRAKNLAVVPQEPCSDTSGVLSIFDHDLCTARAPGRMRIERARYQVRNATGKDASRPQGEAAGAYDCTHHALLHKDWLGCSLMEEKACSLAWNYPPGDVLRGLEAGQIGEMAVLGDREGRLASVTTRVLRYPGVGVLADFS
jgi:hypothetical protein